MAFFRSKDDHFGGVLRVPPFEETPIYNPLKKKGLLFLGEKRGIGGAIFVNSKW